MTFTLILMLPLHKCGRSQFPNTTREQDFYSRMKMVSNNKAVCIPFALHRQADDGERIVLAVRRRRIMLCRQQRKQRLIVLAPFSIIIIIAINMTPWLVKCDCATQPFCSRTGMLTVPIRLEHNRTERIGRVYTLHHGTVIFV